MQASRNAALSAPTNFCVLAFLRHAVRLACRAAASPGFGAEGAPGEDFVAADALLAGVSAGCAAGATAKPPATADRLRHTAAATFKKRALIQLKHSAHRWPYR